MHHFMLLACILLLAPVANAQKPVYLCGKVYTDQPCKEGREVDINPTRGAHSMSGTRREAAKRRWKAFAELRTLRWRRLPRTMTAS